MSKFNPKVKFKLGRLTDFSGEKAGVYSVFLEDEAITLFAQFIQQFTSSHLQELVNMVSRLKTIGHKSGAAENFFRLKEWKLDNKIVALHELPNMKLRLYCIRYSNGLIIIGGGGPKDVRAWQDEHHLRAGADAMIQLSKMIDRRIDSGEIYITPDGKALKGNLKYGVKKIHRNPMAPKVDNHYYNHFYNGNGGYIDSSPDTYLSSICNF